MHPIDFHPLGGSWLLVAAMLGAMTILLLTVTPRARGTSLLARRLETGLRALALLVFAVLFTRPSIVVVEVEELPATVTFLCDLSESMTIEDGTDDGRSRYETMLATFETARDTLRKLGAAFDVRVVGFGETTEELAFEDGVVSFPSAPTGRESRVGEALEEALRASAGKRQLSVALLSDGTQRTLEPDATSPQELALRYRDAGLPLTVVPLGTQDGASRLRDLAITDLRANDRVFIGNELVVSGQLRATGFKGQAIPVKLELETESGKTTVVGEETFTPSSVDATIPWQFVCKPSRAGEWKYRVSTPVQDKELLATNNELSGFVSAIDGGVKALYIEGTRRYEQNFLRAALDSSSDVLVRYWRPPVSSLVGKFPHKTEAELVSTLASSRPSLVEPFFSAGQYATYILGDVDSAAFQKEELEALVELVEQGAGLIVLAGERSLSLGGYAETPLAAALPVETRAGDRVPLNVDLHGVESSGAGDRARLLGDYVVAPAEGALDSRDGYAISLSVDPRKTLELWSTLPPLSDVYRIGRVKRNATTLLTARLANKKEGAGYPLLVVQQYGLGRVAVVATDSTWRWRMRGKETEHAKFWRQVLLWSAKTDELLEGELAIETESSRLSPGESLSFSVSYRPKEGENIEGARAEATIVGPDGVRKSVALTRDQGVWRGLESGLESLGDYQLEAALLSDSGETLQTTRSRFLVHEKNLELERPGASVAAMENLAATTLGKSVAPDAFQGYLEELLKERETIVDTRETKRSFYDSWSVFVAFVLIMTCDWLLRRKLGLV